MSQSFVKRPDNGPHSALSGLGVLANDKITIRYERAGRCFWHIACTAQRHAPPMRIGEDDAEKRRTVIRCVACNEAGYYPHGSVGDVCCERVPAGVLGTSKPDMTAMVDAAMVEMGNIHPPLRRSECERLIRAALGVTGTSGGEQQ